jgi:putative photosynthetic complex assembly protein
MTQIHFEYEPGQKSHIPNLAPPRQFLAFGLVMIATALWLAVSATRFGQGRFDEPDGKAVASRSLVFTDAPDGGITVTDGNSQQVVTEVAPNTNQFLRGAIRGLARSRRAVNASPKAAFILTQYEDGRLMLDDPITGERVAVSSFGPTQIESFRALLLADK